MVMFDYNKQKALQELFIVLGKGIDLLANENLDEDLYEAFEKYANSTIKMAYEAYSYGYVSSFSSSNMSHNYLNPINIHTSSFNHISDPIDHWSDYKRDLYVSILNENSDNISKYKNKLKDLLHKLVSVVKDIAYK